MKNKLSIIELVEEAQLYHIHKFGESPNTVLLGPKELGILLDEMVETGYDIPHTNQLLTICDMIVIPKIQDGIDFPISIECSTSLLEHNYKKAIAEKYN